MIATQQMLLTAAVTLLAAIFQMAAGLRCGAMRGKHKIIAPAVTGHPEFERAYRVQMNTLEQMPVFLPALWLAAIYFKPVAWIVPALGLVWVIGRIVYMQTYMADPAKRAPGTAISMLAQIALVGLAIAGVAMAWTTV